ncbi:conserved hypothetical protein [Flavobacteria bacterium BBFL7]|nr:conserved hypothetical protein [Flavobacteria bacterium BBFL7]
MKHVFSILTFIVLSLNIGCNSNSKLKTTETSPEVKVDTKETTLITPRLLLNLPEIFNSPASGDLDNDGNVIFTSPNLHNDFLIKADVMQKSAIPTIGKIDKNNTLSTWYIFKPEDMDAKSGTVVPFGLDFGPDGNAYVIDMQLWAGGNSRIIKITVENGDVAKLETVVTGLSFPNGLVWKGNDLFISDTVLGETEDGKQISGVYKVNMDELNANNPLKINKYEDSEVKDTHLFETFISSGVLKFGANGITIAGDGNLYTGIMEDGSVFKTTMDADNNKIATSEFAKGMIATDGLKWDAKSNKFYITDLFANAVYSIDMQGKLELLAKNGNTDGADGNLDGPGEVIIRDNEAIVLNFDAAFGAPNMVNTTPDAPYTISVLDLKE